MKYLEDLWEEGEFEKFQDDPVEQLRYRSNLLGADLRITNFGGGNTSSKIELEDPFSGKPVRVLAVKGSGGDLGSMQRQGFALLYLDRLEQLKSRYPGESYEDEMVDYYPLCALDPGRVAPSIDTPLHAFLPFPHVDHLHPDWGIAVAASANGKTKLKDFNDRYGHELIWLPWRRPGFELGLMLERAVTDNPNCDGIVMGSHGLFTWGETQRECYLNSLTIIDRLGEFVMEHKEKLSDQLFLGQKHVTRTDAEGVTISIFPFLRGQLATQKRSIGHFDSSPDVMEFVNSHDAGALAQLGTSCPDHFVRTRICPLYTDWDPAKEDLTVLKEKISRAVERYRAHYQEYYHRFADGDSPAIRDLNPSVVLIPGVGMFTFGKNKKEARITGQFYINAIHVMAGATALGAGQPVPETIPQAGRPEDSQEFTSHNNYVALPLREAFRIEYWALEEAKLQRMPPEKEFSGRIVLVVGGGSGIGRSAALRLAGRDAHVIVADLDSEAAQKVAEEASRQSSEEMVSSSVLDLGDRQALESALKTQILRFGGLDSVIVTAAQVFSPDPRGSLSDEHWERTLDVNVTGNYRLAHAVAAVFQEQGLPASIVLTSSANAVVPKRGSEAYDVSKTAVSHLIRELAVGLAPLIRVNGIAPASVVKRSSMFPRDRVMASLKKYGIDFDPEESTKDLRNRLSEFYAQRTLMGLKVNPEDCAEAIYWLAGDRSSKTTGHIIPVDAGLPEAFLR